MSEDKPKAILETIFDGNTAKILDHLIGTRPFDFSREELVRIHGLTDIEIFNTLTHLENFKLVVMIGDGKNQRYKLADNDKTKHLARLLYLIMLDYMDALSKDPEE